VRYPVNVRYFVLNVQIHPDLSRLAARPTLVADTRSHIEFRIAGCIRAQRSESSILSTICIIRCGVSLYACTAKFSKRPNGG
jgi:hypothetical protein